MNNTKFNYEKAKQVLIKLENFENKMDRIEIILKSTESVRSDSNSKQRSILLQ